MKVKILFVLFIITAFVLGACSPAPVEEPVVEEPVVEEPVVEEPVVEEPVVEEPVVEEPEEPAVEAVELRFMYYADGPKQDLILPLIEKFMAENEGITVILDMVPYQTIDEQLPIQVEAGQGPDLARITNFAIYKGKLLDLRPLVSNPEEFEANFATPILEALGYGGFPDEYTITGPYVNQTLFEQAGIDLPTGETTWEEWTELTKQVAEATGTDYAIGIDRTGHRVAGPAMSMGATLIDDEGNFTIDTPGFRQFIELLKSWHDEGLMPNELWLTGDALNNCIDWFKTADMVMCMTGSWQINGVAADVGDAFDWVVVPNPTGAGGSTGIAGGAAVVAFADTEHPEAAAKLMEFLYAPENYAALSGGGLSLPAHRGVAEAGVDYASDIPSVLAALDAYTAEVPKLQDQAVFLNVHPFAFAYYRNSANRIAQYLAGELSLEEMIANLQSDIDTAIAESN
ncbi:MAG: extracellular solute-binding protein [Brevefilum sp.]|nr:extracellular solute-binding protein [Brevefilum sp.]